MKAEGNICYPLVVSYWKQSQRGKERGAHSRYIISCHIVGIWTSWYDKLIGELFVWEQGKKEKEMSAYNGSTLQKNSKKTRYSVISETSTSLRQIFLYLAYFDLKSEKSKMLWNKIEI